MQVRKIEIFVGFFLLFGFVSLFFLIVKISGLNIFSKSDGEYVIKAVFSNIGGLKVGSKVTIGGVRIGKVSKIKLVLNEDQEYFPIVEMNINKSINIPNDSSASILTAGLLGDNYIGIEIGRSIDFIQEHEIITLTSQALLLEELISKFAVSRSSGVMN